MIRLCITIFVKQNLAGIIEINKYKMKKYLILSIVFISLFSCRIAKKQWVKENYAEKSVIEESLTTQNTLQKNELSKITQEIITNFTQKLQEQKSKVSESESTDVSGTITAEDGKQKYVTIGNTTIKSDGANVTFKTSSNISKEFESRYKELEENDKKQSIHISTLERRLDSVIINQKQMKVEQDIIKTNQTKSVKKSGLSFGSWFILIIVAIVLVAIWFFRKSIPFLS